MRSTAVADDVSRPTSDELYALDMRDLPAISDGTVVGALKRRCDGRSRSIAAPEAPLRRP